MGQASDVIELMDYLKIDKAHIHGYSMGGMITAHLLKGAVVLSPFVPRRASQGQGIRNP